MMMALWVLGAALFSVAVGRWGTAAGGAFLSSKKVMAPNFRNEVIPTSFGGVMALLHVFAVLVAVVIPGFSPLGLRFAVFCGAVCDRNRRLFGMAG